MMKGKKARGSEGVEGVMGKQNSYWTCIFCTTHHQATPATNFRPWACRKDTHALILNKKKSLQSQPKTAYMYTYSQQVAAIGTRTMDYTAKTGLRTNLAESRKQIAQGQLETWTWYFDWIKTTVYPKQTPLERIRTPPRANDILRERTAAFVCVCVWMRRWISI